MLASNLVYFLMLTILLISKVETWEKPYIISLGRSKSTYNYLALIGIVATKKIIGQFPDRIGI